MRDGREAVDDDDEEHLAQVIVDSIREVEKYFEDDEALVEKSFRAWTRRSSRQRS